MRHIPTGCVASQGPWRKGQGCRAGAGMEPGALHGSPSTRPMERLGFAELLPLLLPCPMLQAAGLLMGCGRMKTCPSSSSLIQTLPATSWVPGGTGSCVP